MAAGKSWAPSATTSNGAVPMLNLVKDVWCGVEEPLYAAWTDKPYIHLNSRHGVLISGGRGSAIYMNKSGKCKYCGETEALQRAVDRCLQPGDRSRACLRPDVNFIDGCFGDHKYLAWVPTEPTNRATVYLPSTCCEYPPAELLEGCLWGGDAVLMPSITERSKKASHQRGVAEWVQDWLQQVVRPRSDSIRIFGCSTAEDSPELSGHTHDQVLATAGDHWRWPPSCQGRRTP